MKKRKSSFKGKVGAMAQKEQTQGSSYGYLNLPKGINVFKPEKGRATIDIIPYIVSIDNHPDHVISKEIANKGEEWYRFPFKVHRNVGAGNDTFVCPTTFGKKCPICEYQKKLRNEEAEKEEIKSLNASRRVLYIVIPIEDSNHDEKYYIWDMSHYLFQSKLNEEIDENPEYEVFPDIEEGFSLKLRFVEQQIGKNKFIEVSRVDFEERDAYEEEIINKAPCLDNMLEIKPYTELEKLFFEIDDSDVAKDEIPEDDSKTEVEKPRRKRKSKEPEEDAKETDPAPEEDAKETNPEPEEKRTRRKTKTENPCPHGYEFGVDTDKHNECAVCDVWDECIDKKEENE